LQNRTDRMRRAGYRRQMTGRPLALISGKDPLASIGGHESYVRAHATVAREAGFEPHIFCIGDRPAVVDADFGIVHRVSAPGPVTPPVWLQGPLLARAVVKLLAPLPGPHLIHGFAVWSAAAVSAATALARRGVAAIPVASAYATRTYEVGAMQAGLHAHHGVGQRLRYRAWWSWIRAVDHRIEARGYVRAEAVFVNYESVRALLLDTYGTELRIRRLPYAAASAFSENGGSPVPPTLAELTCPKAPLILAASRHDPRKGLDVLLGALARLAGDGVEFRACLVGPGRLLAAHRRLARRLGLQGRVVIQGAVADVRPYHEHADIFVLPSLAEGSGSVSVLEALQARTAVVASDCDGIPEDLVHDQDALLVAPGDERALATALGGLLTDPAARARLAAAGRHTYERRFSAAAFSAALIEAYEGLGVRAEKPLLARTASAT
jgi:glycosyltransferase involved in cell wall biosynthesis